MSREKETFKMKNQIVKSAATLCMLMMLGIAASAQTSRELTVTVPFDFNVGRTEMPAGTYSVYRLNNYSGEGYMLRSTDCREAVIFNAKMVQGAEATPVNRLEFRQYGDKYFLARVWPAGAIIGRELLKARTERRIARQSSNRTAKLESRGETVFVQNR